MFTSGSNSVSLVHAVSACSSYETRIAAGGHASPLQMHSAVLSAVLPASGPAVLESPPTVWAKNKEIYMFYLVSNDGLLLEIKKIPTSSSP